MVVPPPEPDPSRGEQRREDDGLFVLDLVEPRSPAPESAEDEVDSELPGSASLPLAPLGGP